jgi:hypothetical protein
MALAGWASAATVAAPVITSFTDDTGVSDTDRITNNNLVVISGTSVPDAEINVKVDMTWIVTAAMADENGDWTYDYGAIAPLPDGTHTFIAKVSGDDTSSNSNSYVVIVDTAVEPPVFTGITTDTGASDEDQVTNDRSLQINGTSEPGASLTIYLGEIDQFSFNANGDGIWATSLWGDFPEGEFSAYVTQVDKAGNESGPSETFDMIVDITAPDVPVITEISEDNGADEPDGVTNDDRIFIIGTAEPFTIVTVRRGTTVIGTAEVDEFGDWTFDYTAVDLADADYSFSAKAKDLAGNQSAYSGNFSVVIDTVAPSRPTMVIQGETGGTPYFIDTTDITLNGTGVANGMITVEVDGVGEIGTDVINGDETWWTTYSFLEDGTYTIRARQFDVAGNSSTDRVITVTVDTTLPDPPVIEGISTDTGSDDMDGITSDRSISVYGTGEVGATVVFVDGDTGDAIEAAVNGDGEWIVALPGPLAEDVYDAVCTQVDRVGNESAESNHFALTVDITPPDPVVVTSPLDDATTDSTPIFVGTAGANAVLLAEIDGEVVDTVTADGAGDWTWEPAPLLAGRHGMQVRISDDAGNESEGHMAFTVGIPDGMYIVNDEDNDYTEPTGIWLQSTKIGFGNSHSRSSADQAATASWEVTVPDGWYEVSIYKIQGSSAPTAMSVAIDCDGDTVADATKSVNCTLGSSGWVVMGTYFVSGGTCTLTASQPTARTMRTDAARLIRSAEVIIDNGDAGYVETGTFIDSAATGFQGSMSRRSAVAGDSAEYTANLQAGEAYTVFVYRIAKSNNSSSVDITVTAQAGPAPVKNMSLDTDNGATTGWFNAGTYVMGATGVVHIERRSTSSTAGLQVDAVRFDRAGEYAMGAEESGYGETGEWDVSADTGFIGSVTHESVSVGARAEWFTPLFRGTYKVYIWRMPGGAASESIKIYTASGPITKGVNFSASTAANWYLLGTYPFYEGVGRITAQRGSGGDNPMHANTVYFQPTALPKEAGAAALSDPNPGLPVGNG